MDHPVAVESFTVPEAAEALGRSLSTIRRWIDDDRIPAPYLQENTRNHRVYSVGELEVVARVLSQHERDFVYLAGSDGKYAVETLRQAMHAYRAQYI